MTPETDCEVVLVSDCDSVKPRVLVTLKKDTTLKVIIATLAPIVSLL